MYTAKIIKRETGNDNVILTVEFSDGTNIFEKIYPLVVVADFENSIRLTIADEVRRINDIHDSDEYFDSLVDQEITG